MSDNNAVASKDERVVAHMMVLRDARAALKKKFEHDDAGLKAQWAKGEAYLRQRLEEAGHTKFSVSSGTVFTSSRVSASIADKSAFGDFVKATGEVELMEYRVSTTALKEYMERTDGAVPPGVNVSTISTLNIRKK